MWNDSVSIIETGFFKAGGFMRPQGESGAWKQTAFAEAITVSR